MQGLVNTEFTEKCKNDPEAEDEKFTFFLHFADPDLKLVIERWPELSAELRRAISRLIR